MKVPTVIQQLIEEGALFVANHSGGKDSQAMLIKLAKIIPASQLLVVHASLGDMEWPGALEHARHHAELERLPFIVARAKKSLLDMVLHRHATRPDAPSWPSAKHRQCTSDLKRGPIQREVRRYAKENGFKIVVNCMGMRAAESSNRAKRNPFSAMGISNSVLTWFEWLPVHDMTTEQVFTSILCAGQKPHPAYAEGNERLSCVFCVMASRNDLRNGAKHNPKLLKRYAEVERITGYTMHMSRVPLLELVGGEQ